MIDQSLTDIADAQRDREATFVERTFLRFCAFKYTRIPVSRGVLYAEVVLYQN